MKMSVYSKELSVPSRKRVELLSMTSQVGSVVSESKIKTGICLLFSPHTTTAIFTNENESNLLADIEEALEKLIPVGGSYRHNRIDSNSDAHLRGILVSNSLTVPIEGGSLALGTWQTIFFADFDGPRHRRVKVTVVGE
ncbi:MAG: YjbQ family protein [Gemmatimonadota bacterium]|nr:MAG: YjbQ family protein [Gemmatimonadota bacterium]